MLSAIAAPSRPILPAPPAVVAESPVRVIVANADGARIFEPVCGGALRPLAPMKNAGRPMPESAVEQDVTACPVDTATMRAHFYADAFARDLCRRLAELCDTLDDARIYLLAEDSFLDLIHAHLDAFTHAHVVRDIAGDYVGHNAEFIRALLPRHL